MFQRRLVNFAMPGFLSCRFQGWTRQAQAAGSLLKESCCPVLVYYIRARVFAIRSDPDRNRMRSGALACTSARRSSLLLAAAGLTGSWSSIDYLAGGGGGFAVTSSNAAWSPGALFVSAVSVSSSSAASGHPASSSPSSRILRTAVDIEGEQDQDDDSFSSSRAGPRKVVDEAVTFTQKDVGSGTTAAKLQREGSTTTSSRKVATTATIRKETAARTGAPPAPSSSVQQQVETFRIGSNPKTGKSRSHDTTRLVRTAASSSTSDKSNTREAGQEEQKEKK